ncbi:MAG: methyltransferase domain-containing protein [Actinomycetota bacterium]|nr:methyltransferase domain-containing protein [Actinomycetota bacterium]
MLEGNETWIPNELDYAGRENRDPEHAARYDQKEDADASRELDILRDLGVGAHSTVVDLGAGTGQFSLEASSAVSRVVAVDVSPVMLSRLQAKLSSAGVKNVECKIAGFLTYVHEGSPADVVYSRFALHHLPDFWKALALHRITAFLRPGGILRLWDVVYSFEPAEASQRIKDWMAAIPATGGENDWIRADLEEHVRDENRTFTWLLEPMLERAGFTIESAEYSGDQIFARYLCVNSG